MATMTRREHIEEIRREVYWIGAEVQKPPRVFNMLQKTVKLLSDELYAKEVHFLMELIQNAEDNEYPEGVDPSLEFVLTYRDITGTGAPATLLVFNNEKGFSAKNLESICSAGLSTKEGNRKSGKIGEKGIGFKSVFKITARPYIFSNGYQIRFSEDPCPHCKIAYMVPEWVEEKPCLSDIKQIYGSDSTLPTTTIILPLKPDKVNPVMQQLSTVHPELLLFLAKIKKLSVREHNESSGHNTLSSISINSETECVARKNIDAESYTVFLSANGNQFDKECSYYMWRQKFPVKEGYRDEKRMDIEEWVITLAFPRGERLQRGTNSPGVYAFLPTEMVTKFPFIIQADFRLASSRETILGGNKWNEGILGCVPSAFVNALMTLVKEENAPVSSLAWMFNFLPVNDSPYQELNLVRDSIKVKMLEEAIVPSETYLEQKFFHKPREVGRLMPAFWNILKKAKKQGVSLNNLSSHGIYVLNSAFDREEYNQVLDFLGVKPVNNDWYAKCIQSTNLVLGVPEDVYSELLLFLADNWSSKFSSANFGYIPLVKYADRDGNVSLCCINDLAQTAQYSHQKVVCVSDHQSWLIGWNREFRCVGNRFFMPTNTYDAIRSCYRKEVLMDWLRKSLQVLTLTVNDYAGLLISHLNSERKLAVAYAHFLYHSLYKNYISSKDVSYLCRNQMPLVDNYGNVSTRRSGVLVPANGSKWVQLIVSNPWREQGFVELGEDYLHPGYFAGQNTPGEEFFEFLKSYVRAADIPHISPPDVGIPCVYAPLTKTNAFLLLEWIKNLRLKGIDIPPKLLTCIKAGSWLRVSTNGYSGYKPPSESFFLTSSLGEILQNGSVLVDIPLVDHSYYGESIHKYKEELKSIGVMFEYAEACVFIGKRLMSMAASTNNVTKSTALSILNFIKFLVGSYLSPESFIRSIESGRWLRTYQGYKSPAECVLFDQKWEVASQISDIPFIDQHYYGEEEILRFDSELKLLGVIVGFNQNYQLVADNLKSSAGLHYLTAEAFLLLLKCMRHSTSSNKLVQALRNAACLKTNCGHRSPGQCFLYDPVWGCLLNVFGDFPIIDTTFYGSTICSWKVELKKLGVVVDLEEAAIAFARLFTQKARSNSISKANILLLLGCYRQLKKMAHNFPPEFNSCIREERWLRTGVCGYRSPKECILFGPAWESISPITALPFIDDSDSFYGKDIHEYSKELKSMGVVVKFEDGVEFVLNGLCSFLNPSVITSAHVLALLKCIRISKEKNYPLPDSFLRKVSQKWLKTHAGDDYYSPKECCLFDSNWESCLKRADGPFIDETFYGSEIKLYREELKQIGVAVDVGKLCPLLASHLDFHSDFEAIVRIYNFLRESNWEPDSEAARMIWIPNGSEDGQWVSPGECVLHDKDGLFGSQLNVLEKHYDRNLLSFFSSAFEVKSNPSVDDYCKLWKVWESSRHALSNSECCVFWRFVKKHWSPKTQKHLADNLLQLPVNSDSDGILLLNKLDVFIADDLQLKDVFQHSSSHPLFVWDPQPSLPDLPRTELLEMYRKIGVRTLSESVKWEELSLQDGVEQKQVNPGEISVGRGLLKLILGFLAKLELEAKERHEAVKGLLNLNALETAEPISVRYSLPLSTGEPVVVSASQMIRWDKESSKFFTQKIDRSGGHKNLIEYATHFSEAISKGVLWNREEHISAFSELIKCGFLLEFDEAAVGFLMKSKNLEIFVEDEEFLSAAFHSE